MRTLKLVFQSYILLWDIHSKTSSMDYIILHFVWSAFLSISVNGGLSSWSSWEECTETCGGGRQHRYRYCTNPSPSNGGAFCVGLFNQSRICGVGNCPGTVLILKVKSIRKVLHRFDLHFAGFGRMIFKANSSNSNDYFFSQSTVVGRIGQNGVAHAQNHVTPVTWLANVFAPTLNLCMVVSYVKEIQPNINGVTFILVQKSMLRFLFLLMKHFKKMILFNDTFMKFDLITFKIYWTTLDLMNL